MSRIYKADIAEKILLSGETIPNQEDEYFQIGGKVLFDDLSALRSIGNIAFLEKTTPKGIMSSEFIDIKLLKLSDETDILTASLRNKEGNCSVKALLITPNYQLQAECDFKSITVFHNGECAVEDFQTGEYVKYDKLSTNNLCSNFNIDTNLVVRKLQHDNEIKNGLTPKKNKITI